MQPLKITELPFFIGGSDQVSNLNIELFISTVADKINFGVVQLADLNFIATAPHFQIYDVLIQLVAVKFFAFLDNVPPSQSCMGTMQVAAALRRISAIMLL